MGKLKKLWGGRNGKGHRTSASDGAQAVQRELACLEEKQENDEEIDADAHAALKQEPESADEDALRRRGTFVGGASEPEGHGSVPQRRQTINVAELNSKRQVKGMSDFFDTAMRGQGMSPQLLNVLPADMLQSDGRVRIPVQAGSAQPSEATVRESAPLMAAPPAATAAAAVEAGAAAADEVGHSSLHRKKSKGAKKKFGRFFKGRRFSASPQISRLAAPGSPMNSNKALVPSISGGQPTIGTPHRLSTPASLGAPNPFGSSRMYSVRGTAFESSGADASGREDSSSGGGRGNMSRALSVFEQGSAGWFAGGNGAAAGDVADDAAALSPTSRSLDGGGGRRPQRRHSLQERHESIVTIQKHMRARTARRVARRRHQWQIFSSLELQEDREMMEVAAFLQRIVEWDASGGNAAVAQAVLERDNGGDEAGGADGGGNADLLKVNTITISDADSAAGLEYRLPRGPLTEESALCVVEALRQGGKLTIKGCHRILREYFRVAKELPNVCRCDVPDGTSVTVVGDLHGQVADLFAVLRQQGYPSATNKYVFNGDFVDRGPQGVEIVLILFCFALVFPEYVFLNRGNHEDYFVACAYGFQAEVRRKYDNLTFSMFVECFRQIPISTIVADKVFVVHGGLFHRRGVTIETLSSIPRVDFVPQRGLGAAFRTALAPAANGGDATLAAAGMSSAKLEADDDARDVLLELMRDALWSDPWDGEGLAPNPRGAGVVFDEAHTREFLELNGLDMVVRSHECVPEGWLRVFPDGPEGCLCTVFSASNYGFSGNKGAIATFSREQRGPDAEAVCVGAERMLWFQITTYETTEAVEDDLIAKNELTINGLVLRKKGALREAFQVADEGGTGSVSKREWADIMCRVVGIQARWLLLLPVVAKEDHLVGDGNIDYNAFLRDCQTSFRRLTDQAQGTETFFNALYNDADRLRALFNFFDRDGDGLISHADFQNGCMRINKELPPERRLTKFHRVLEIMNFTRGDSVMGVDLNEWLESFRLSALVAVGPEAEAADGGGGGGILSSGDASAMDTSATEGAAAEGAASSADRIAAVPAAAAVTAPARQQLPAAPASGSDVKSPEAATAAAGAAAAAAAAAAVRPGHVVGLRKMFSAREKSK